jgi:signal transduction histidine kinase
VPDPLDTNSLLNNILFTLYDDGKGNLWIPSWGGLDKLDKKTGTFTHYTHDPDDPNSISSNKTIEVYEDTSGRLWVTTYGGGLNLFNPKQETFTHYTEENGFPTNEINSILEDDAGNLWLGTGAGIVEFNPDDGTVKQYTTSDGLQGDLFFEGARLKTRDGTMWFSGMGGVNSFHPDQITTNPTIPPVYVVSFKQGGEEMDLGKAPERVKEITLDWHKNFFEFELVALNYTHAEKNQFAYILEGFDKEWYQAGTQRFGRYSGLPGGEYTLRIKGSNNDGVWNEEGTSIKVKVIPPSWATWWFRGTAIMILIVAVLGIYAWRVRAIDAQKRQFQVLVAERTRDLETAQAELLRKERLATLGQVAATVSHEIRNPLATIQISATVVDHKIRGKGLDDVEPVLDRIQRNVTRCDNIIGELLDYARTSEPNLKRVRFDDWLNQVLDEQNLPGGITLSRDLASGVDVSLDPERFRRLIINLVDNAWQAMLELPETSDRARVLSVKSSVVADRLKVVISDTGPGISPDVRPRIFEPLYSTKNFGVGLGLSVVEEIVKQHGGEIEISSEAGKGTQVAVRLPLS